MLASEINIENGTIRGSWSFNKETLIESANSDSYTILNSEESKAKFIADNGDVEVIFDTKYKVYRVPAFAESRKSYSDAKQIDCRRWGCE